jgi:YbbR domain-containing protein
MRRLSNSARFAQYLRQVFIEHWSFKLVALFIALILWLTILGRRDFVLSKTIDVDLLLQPGISLVLQSADKVKVKVSGPRTALKRFMDSGLSQMVTIDASSRGEGEYDLEVPVSKIDVPFGVRVLQVRPSSVKVQLKKTNSSL